MIQPDNGAPTRGWWLYLALTLAGAGVTVCSWLAGRHVERTAPEPAGTNEPVVRGRPTLETTTDSATLQRQAPRTLARAASAATAATGLSPMPWPFWEYRLKQPLPPRSPPLVPPPWRLIGATANGASWSLIVLRQGQTAPEIFKVGDKLPGGYRIDAISQDEVTLDSSGRAVVLSFIGIR